MKPLDKVTVETTREKRNEMFVTHYGYAVITYTKLKLPEGNQGAAQTASGFTLNIVPPPKQKRAPASESSEEILDNAHIDNIDRIHVPEESLNAI